MKRTNTELVFAPLKVKKIMQDNKDIGKVANMSPYVVSKSLEYFLKDLLNDAIENAKTNKTCLLHPFHIKAAILKNPKLSFLKEEVEGISHSMIKKKRNLENSDKK